MQHDPGFTAPPNLDDVLAVPASRGAWRVRAIAAGVTAVACVVLLAQLAWPRLAHPATQAPSSYSFLLTSNVTWASFAVVIGNKRTTFAPQTPVSILLHTAASPYQVQVSAMAPPFAARQCRLTVPPAKDDTCVIQNAQPTPHLAFAFGLTDLPTTQQTAVAMLIAAGLRNTVPATIIPVGGHYVTGDLLQQSHSATEPLEATLTTTVAPPNLIVDTACLQLCAAEPPDWAPSALDLWHVRLFVSQEWHFARATDGSHIGTTSENLVPHAITFDLNYDVGQAAWFFVAPTTGRALADALVQPLCDDGGTYVQSLYFVTSSAIEMYNPTPMYEDYQLAGCLIRLTATHSNQRATFLWHTAQLYTVDAGARAVEPTLVQASPQDLAALG
jgi:hypothetical protein